MHFITKYFAMFIHTWFNGSLANLALWFMFILVPTYRAIETGSYSGYGTLILVFVFTIPLLVWGMAHVRDS